MLKRLRRRLGRRRSTALSTPELADFLDVARRSFVGVQQAWDRADLAALSRLATGPLLDELREQLAARGPGPNVTEVLRVEARLLGVHQLSQAQVASVEFSGLIREHVDQRPVPFRELWMLARLEEPDPGWRVARVQSLS
ncbi:MAG: Tim44 domain-containing protein [Rubrivivax sp.]|nr:Tim44 domain-containing protein [Rubrivivax sp.]